MKRVTLENSDLNMSRLGFGTSSLHRLPGRMARRKLIFRCLDLGISHFDTAPLYGEGFAEREIGRILGVSRSQITLATKFGLPNSALLNRRLPLIYGKKIASRLKTRFGFHGSGSRHRDLTKVGVDKQFKQSLKHLKTDYVDLLMLHEPSLSDAPSLDAIIPWVEALRRDGFCRYVGLAGKVQPCIDVSLFAPDIFQIFQVEDSTTKCEADTLRSHNLPIQITYGYLRRAREYSNNVNYQDIMRDALRRNADGAILISARSERRISELASVLV